LNTDSNKQKEKDFKKKVEKFLMGVFKKKKVVRLHQEKLSSCTRIQQLTSAYINDLKKYGKILLEAFRKLEKKWIHS